MLRGLRERHGEELGTEPLVELEASEASCDVGVVARLYGERGYALFDESVLYIIFVRLFCVRVVIYEYDVRYLLR